MMELVDNSKLSELFTENFAVTIKISDRKYTYSFLEYPNAEKLYRVSYWLMIGDECKLTHIGYYNLITKEFTPIDKFKGFSQTFWPKHMRYISLMLTKLDKLESKFKVYKGVPDDC